MDEKQWVHCNQCGGYKYHTLLHSDNFPYSEEVEPGIHVHGWDLYEMFRCGGCGGVSLRHTYYFSEDGSDPSSVQYPPPISRREPQWATAIWMIDQNLGDLLREIYVAVQNNSCRLAAMGIRALLESVMIDKVSGDLGSFGKNLRAFSDAGFLSSRQTKSLSTILDAGHATIHRGWTPSDTDLTTLLDITENILQTVYIHTGQAEALGKKIPPRRH